MEKKSHPACILMDLDLISHLHLVVYNSHCMPPHAQLGLSGWVCVEGSNIKPTQKFIVTARIKF